MERVGYFFMAMGLLFAGCRSADPGQGNTTPHRAIDATYWSGAEKPVSFDVAFLDKPLTFQRRTSRTVGASPDMREIVLTRFGQTLVERYLVDDRGVALLGYGSDAFDPPIPLLRYGTEAGQKWTWIGVNRTSGARAIPASADLGSADEVMRCDAGTYSTVKVVVALRLGEETAALEELAFWFSPGEGLVKAKLGGYTRTIRPSGSR